ncbi:MAG TPA: permease-like cell division protein FtsX [Candidatus Acidoferrum sp.]|jgi:cell division transport system permease protein|nr:permease-like cell division protein FtsX [Candidatus Acidoferrum sp.]
MARLGIVVKGALPRAAMARTVVGNTIRYLLFGAARNWFRNIGSIAPALGSMTLLLLMAGVAGLAGFAISNLEHVESAQASLLHVYISDGASSGQITSLWDRLAADPRVASVVIVTKQEALQRAESIPGLPQIASASDSNPFPASLDVQVKTINDMAAIATMVRTDAAVDPVNPSSYDQGAYQRIQTVIFGIALAGLVFLAVLAFVAVAVTINSVRAAIHSRHDEVTIMQLVGAPRWMVRGPFVVEGAITGALAGAVAGLATFGLAMAGISAGAGTFTSFAPGVTVSVAAIAAVIVLATGVGLGSGSSLVSVRRHLES